MAERDALAQLQGFSLTTAEILYRLPDHPSLLQTYVWQEYDLHPRFPRLKAFLGFWTAFEAASRLGLIRALGLLCRFHS